MPPQSSNGQPNFDFIMNPGKPPKKPVLPSGSSTAQRAIFVGVGIVLVLIAIVVVSNLLSAGSKEQKTTLLKAAQQQTEIARVAQLAAASASQSTKNLAINANLTLASDQKVMVSTLTAHGLKLNDKDFSLSMDQKTDASLEAAKAAANFDATFITILTTQLKDYEATLTTAYNGSKNKEVQDTLRANFTNADMLVKQAAETKP